jgi:hypothetical protein
MLTRGQCTAVAGTLMFRLDIETAESIALRDAMDDQERQVVLAIARRYEHDSPVGNALLREVSDRVRLRLLCPTSR